MNRKILTMTDKPQNEMADNTWKKLQGGGSNQHADVLFKCDLCKWFHVIGINHTIDKDGTVMPSVGIPFSGEGGGNCGYHEWIKLEGWIDGNSNN
jgi:hypothetical protein